MNEQSAQLSAPGQFALMLVACLTIMVGCVIVPGLPAIAPQLGVPHAASWLITLPSLGVVLFGPLAGSCIEKLGLHKTLLIGLFGYGLLGVGGMFLHGMIIIFADRLLLGGATAMVMSSGTALLTSFYTGSARLKIIARQGMAIELGGVFFLAIGGQLATIGWRWPFLLYLVAWLCLICILAFVPNKSASSQEKESVSKSADRKITPLIKFVFFSAVLSQLIFFCAIITIPQYFHSLGIRENQTGFFLSFISVIAVISASQMPRINRKFGDVVTLAIAFISYCIAHLILWQSTNLSVLIVGAIFMGCGFGLSIPLVNHMTVEYSAPVRRGRNLAYLSMAIFSGQFLSSFLDLIPVDASSLFVIAAIIALVTVFVVLVKGNKARRHYQHSQQNN
ncbi:MFS transporter [Celerinatantimonas sp. MCCC 1A17872]|uniref:MFS transporter n=1 Tax=Celerinatantimonas sp. MCCC 1A17872 TaxID=3177514 RepID=UPI0038BFB838